MFSCFRSNDNMFRVLTVVFCICCVLSEAQTNPTCLRDWSYFAKSNKCFKLFGGQVDGVARTTWSLAKEYCNRFNGGHLASVHSDDEITFIVDLVQKGLYDDGYAGRVFIGHQYTGGEVNYAWEDGSAFTYTKWWFGDLHISIEVGSFPPANPAGVLHTQRLFAGTMWLAPYTDKYAFVCQAPPVSEGG